MPAYHNIFLRIVTITSLGCIYAIALALIWFLFSTPLAITFTVILSLFPLSAIRHYLNAQGKLKYPDDSGFFGVLALILLVIGGINSADLNWILSGVVILSIALYRYTSQPTALSEPLKIDPTPYHVKRIPLFVGTMLMLGVAEISGQIFKIPLFAKVSIHWQFIALIIGITLITAGIIGNTNFIKRAWSSPARLREMGLIGAIVLFGFLLRVLMLQEAQRFVIDEILFIKPIVRLWDHSHIPLFEPFSTIASFPIIYPYLQSWSVELFGSNLFAIRFISVLFGTAGIFALYLLSRVLFGRWIAVISAFLLAILPIHIQFSRIGINNIADPFFGTLALYFIASAVRQPERMKPYLGLAGICTGLTQYWYDGGRFIFLALSVLWLGGLLISRLYQARHAHQRPTLVMTLRACLMFVIGFILIAFPVYYTLYGLDKPLSSRFERVGMTEFTYQDVNQWTNLLEKQLAYVYHLHFSQPEIDFYYAGDDPIIPRHAVALFIGGVVVGLSLLFRRKLIGALIVLWLGLVWGGNLLLQSPDISARYVVELPLIALLIAIGLDTFGMLILRRERLYKGAIIIVLLIFAVMQVSNYFGDYMERYNYQFRHEQTGRNRDIDDMLLRAADFPQATNIYILDELPFPTSDLNRLLRFYRGTRSGWRDIVYVKTPRDAHHIQHISRDVDHAFFVSTIHPAGMDDLIQTLYPELEGPFYTDYEPAMSAQYVLYILPALN